MSETKVLQKSIFDIIEEEKNNPEEFDWKKDPSLFTYDPLEVVHKGMLSTNFCNVLKTNYYIFTVKGVIKHKVIL